MAGFYLDLLSDVSDGEEESRAERKEFLGAIHLIHP
jgi:hypothetical protein